MSATMISDPMNISALEAQPMAGKLAAEPQNEIEFAICDCCGLTEECTPAYIERVRERYYGKWICGLCAEAVKDEIIRSERLLSNEEAMANHINFCKKFRTSGPPLNPTVHLISTMRQILRRSLDSPKGLRSTPTNPPKTNRPGLTRLTRSKSCFSSLPTPQAFEMDGNRTRYKQRKSVYDLLKVEGKNKIKI